VRPTTGTRAFGYFCAVALSPLIGPDSFIGTFMPSMSTW
jgi:hypothetical protein